MGPGGRPTFQRLGQVWRYLHDVEQAKQGEKAEGKSQQGQQGVEQAPGDQAQGQIHGQQTDWQLYEQQGLGLAHGGQGAGQEEDAASSSAESGEGDQELLGTFL